MKIVKVGKVEQKWNSDKLFRMVGFLVLGFTIVLGGCAGRPSKKNVEQAVRDCYSRLTALTVPPRIIRYSPGFSRGGGDEVDIEHVRVTKFGKPYRSDSVWNPGMRYPVRVYLKGTCSVRHNRTTLKGRLPFEGEMDFTVEFKQPDRRRVDPGPGKWETFPEER